MDTLKGFVRTGTSLATLGLGIKTTSSILSNSATGFLAAKSKYMFIGILPISNSVIIMLGLSLIGLLYVWHKDINK